MKNHPLALFAAAALVSASGCKKGEDPAATIAKLEAYKIAMCKCTDAACATKVTEGMTKWSSKDQNIDEAVAKRITELTTAMSVCAQNANSSSAAAIAKMEEFKTAMCTCTDAACTAKVTEDMTRWSQEFAKTAPKDVKIDEATTKKMTEVTTAISACAQTANNSIGAAMAKMEEFKTAMCKCTDAACATMVTASMTSWSQAFARTAPKDVTIDAETTQKMTELTMTMSECAQKVMTSGDSAAAPAAVAGDLPSECAEYKAAVEALAPCDPLPQATRDALRGSFEQIAESWANTAKMTPESKVTTRIACKSAAESVKQAGVMCNGREFRNLE